MSFGELKTAIGLTFMTGATAAAYEGKGLCVFHVKPGEPAAVAGIKEGDVITAVDSKPTKTQEQFTAIFDTKRPGDKSEFKLLRKGKKMKLQVQFGAVGVKLQKALKLRAKAGVDSDDDATGDDEEEAKQEGGWWAWLGFGKGNNGSDSESEDAEKEVEQKPVTTDAQLLAALGISGHVVLATAEHVLGAQSFLKTVKPFIGLAMQESGPYLCITSVEAGSPAASAGLAIGSAVTNINSKPVTGGAANFPSYWRDVRPGDVVAITTCELVGSPQKLGQSTVSRLMIGAQGLTSQQLDAVQALSTAAPGGPFPVRTETWLRSAQPPETPAYAPAYAPPAFTPAYGAGFSAVGGAGNQAELRALVEDIARQRLASVSAHFAKLQQELDREKARMLAEVEQERAALLRKIG